MNALLMYVVVTALLEYQNLSVYLCSPLVNNISEESL